MAKPSNSAGDMKMWISPDLINGCCSMSGPYSAAMLNCVQVRAAVSVDMTVSLALVETCLVAYKG